MNESRFKTISDNVREIEKDLDILIGYNSTASINEESLQQFFEENKTALKSLMMAFASIEESRYSAIVGKFVVHIERKGWNWKAFILNNALGSICTSNFNVNNLKPFNPVTNNGIQYIEFSADKNSVKILLIKYEKAVKILTSKSDIAKYPDLQGQGYHHINDVFNIMQSKSANIKDDNEIRHLTEDDVDIHDLNGLLANIIRASTYMFNNAYQTVSLSDSVYLNKNDIYDDSEAIHKRCAAYYTPGNVCDGLAFTNFRNQLTYKNKNNNTSKTACNHIGACFSVNKNVTTRTVIERMNYLSLQPSIGLAIEFNWQ